MPGPAFRAGRDPVPKFADLGEPAGFPVEAKISKRPKKYYPSVSIRRGVKGLDKVGQMRTVRVKVRVNSIELREGEVPRMGLELRGIEEG